MKKPVILLLFLFISSMTFSQVNEEVADSPKKEFRFAVQGGLGYRLGSLPEGIPSAQKDFLQKLKTGYTAGIDAAYFLEPSWGIGLKLNNFRAKETISASISTNEGHEVSTLSDQIDITYFGPSYVSKYVLNNPAHTFFGGISLGYLGYLDRAEVSNGGQSGINQSEIKGATFGAAFDLAYDYAISKYFTIGAQASVTGGTLSKITIKEGDQETSYDLEEDNRENLSRLDISAGLRFRI